MILGGHLPQNRKNIKKSIGEVGLSFLIHGL